MRNLAVIPAAVAWLTITALAAQAATATPAPDMKRAVSINVGGGLSVPTGTLADQSEANMGSGWLVNGGLDYFITKDIGIGVDGAYTAMSNKDDSDLKAKTAQYGVHGRYLVPSGGPLVPYLQVGVGMYSRKIEYKPSGVAFAVSDTKAGVNGGVGVGYKLNGLIGIGVSGAYHFTFGKMEVDGAELMKDWNYVTFAAGIDLSIKPAAK